MADVTITPEEFSDVIAEFVKFGMDENKKKVTSGIKKIAREARQEVETKSRRSKKEYDGNTDDYTGSKRFAKDNAKHYKESWTTSTLEEKGTLTVIVHNKKWQLVHLLENGHLLKDGTGRVYGEVPAYEHVEPVQKHAEEKVNALLEAYNGVIRNL